MTIKYFEDLEVWKEARHLTRQVYQITHDAAFSRDFGLRDQIRRAAVSVMSILPSASSEEETGNSFSFFTSPGLRVARCVLNFMWRSIRVYRPRRV